MNKYIYKPKFYYAAICKHVFCDFAKTAYGWHVGFWFAPHHLFIGLLREEHNTKTAPADRQTSLFNLYYWRALVLRKIYESAKVILGPTYLCYLYPKKYVYNTVLTFCLLM